VSPVSLTIVLRQCIRESCVQFTCLDVRQGHEVLGDVNNKLVHKSRSNVKTVHVVIQVIPEIPPS